jgi:serine phosphatase RsbU (regulator of sigma subunit)
MSGSPGDHDEIADSLATGVAIAGGDSWRIEYANSAFRLWFPVSSEDCALEDCLTGLKADRARRRLEKGRPFAFESEFKAGPRATALRTTLREVERGGRRVVLVQTVDITKQKEQEHMLDSFAKISDGHKRALERANAALERKTNELQEAYDVITQQKSRMQRELDVARQVQMSMLPMDFATDSTACTVAGLLKPALEVGGDFFDFFYVDTNLLCFVVGDVSDKGAASGLFMAAAKTLIKPHATRARSTAGIVGRVNRELAVGNDSCMFVTLFLAIVDLATGEVVYTNAGHNPPYRIGPNQDPEAIVDRHGPPVGIDESVEFGESSFVLEPGELLVVYTDGVTEATNAEGDLFGEDRLKAILASEGIASAEYAVRTISEAVEAFEVGTTQSDDVTLIGLMFCGPQG